MRRRSARRAIPAVALTLAAVLTVGAWLVPAASAHQRSGRYLQVCRLLGRITVYGHYHSRFFMRNDNFGRQRECLTNRNLWPNFVVTTSGARSRSPEAMAYPEIQLGCAWGRCTPNSGLPRRVSRLRSPVTSWSISTSTTGLWDAGYDMWFSLRKHTSGQDRGAEIMIWINEAFGRPGRAHATIVRIGGFRYYLEHWVAHNRATGTSWNYVLFRRYHPANQVHRLRLKPFLKLAERRGLLKRSWWLTSIDAGFEIWRGGQGLATNWYWARV